MVQIHNRQNLFHLQNLQKPVERTLELLGKKFQGEVSRIDVYLVSKKQIAQLHAQFLNDPTPTDVITFQHGEIFVCPSVAERQRKATGLSLRNEVLTYIIHGLLHLCGWDDHSEGGFTKMRQKQESLLKAIVK